MMSYISTRGTAPTLGFAEAALAGLARDGGLYVPKAVPILSAEDIRNMAHQSYLEIAFRLMQPFVGEDIPAADFSRLLKNAYKNFPKGEVAPLRPLTGNFQVMELFHGPTLAFKDVALQFLGQVFDYLLERQKQRVTIVGATSGDTGSAAIDAFRDKKNVDIFILHPKGRVSEVQRRQMTTVLSPNVFNVAVEGSFDDCQDLVKALFNDAPFRDRMKLSAVNSINFARILAQTVYYVFAAARLQKPVSFVVPTGNFGNVYAGYLAKAMGAPIEKLVVATNKNDILHRFLQTGDMRMEDVRTSLSPSMDIQVSSNFERVLFDLLGRDGAAVEKTMRQFRADGVFRLGAEAMARLQSVFESGRKSDDETLAVMKEIYEAYEYVADPHTAVGIGVAKDFRARQPARTIVTLATAHPAKFPDAVEKAIGLRPALPSHLADLYARPEKYDVLMPDEDSLKKYIQERAEHA